MLSELFRSIEPVNFPEGYKDGPHCPHTKLIQLTADLAGIKLEPETFCGKSYDHAKYSGGAFSHLVSAFIYPQASCAKINRALYEQLETVAEKIDEPSDKETTAKIDDAKTIQTKAKIFEEYKNQKEEHEVRQQIVDRWRKVVFENCVSTTSDEENVHFRQFRSKDELSESEVIKKVKDFAEALQKIIGFSYRTNGWYSNEANNCKQSPHSGHFGVFED